MKIQRLVILLVVGAAGAWAMGYKVDFLPALPDSVMNSLDGLVPGVKTSSGDSPPAKEETNTVYKWKDASGKLHYSNAPPKKDENVTELRISNQQNVVPSRGIPPAPNTAVAEPETSGNPLSGLLESYRQPVEKATDARGKMEQHNRQLENVAR